MMYRTGLITPGFRHGYCYLITILCVCTVLTGCGSISTRFANQLGTAFLNQDDPETVRDGAPTFLLLIDAQIEGDDDNVSLLLAGAKLYGAYATNFVDDNQRAKRLADKSMKYARKALCLELEEMCSVYQGPYQDFLPVLEQITDVDDVPVLYGFATAWAGWIQLHIENWSAIADVPKIEAMMQKVVALDEGYDGGGAHVYLGVIMTQLPDSLGGKTEQGREHFERAIALSNGHNLMAKVLLAKNYARLTFDRELHDGLLNEVLEADTVAPGLTLINVFAQRQARELLDSGDDYF